MKLGLLLSAISFFLTTEVRGFATENTYPICDLVKPERVSTCDGLSLEKLTPLDIMTPAEKPFTPFEMWSQTLISGLGLDKTALWFASNLFFGPEKGELLDFSLFKETMLGLRHNIPIFINFTDFQSAKDGIKAQLILNGVNSDPNGSRIISTSWIERQTYIKNALNTPKTNKEYQRDDFFKFIPITNRASYTNLEFIPDNTTAFKKLIELINSARSSIDIMTWMFSDDDYSNRVLSALDAQLIKYPNLRVRVIVDKLATEAYQLNDFPQKLAKLPRTEVIAFKDPNFTYGVQHRKLVVADGERCLTGGRNIGRFYYSKMGFIDADVSFGGPLAQLATKVFEGIWQEQILTQNLNYPKVAPKPLLQLATGSSGDGNLAGILSEQPSSLYGRPTNTLLTMMNSIRLATSSIRISNAYIIEFPLLSEELKAASERGVKVEILTNSPDSNDIPSMNLALLSSIFRMKEKIPKAEIYLSKFKTLHHKLMVVDDIFSMVGSYNLHPRSERIDGELNYFFWDKHLANQISEEMNSLVHNEMEELISLNQIKFLQGSEYQGDAKYTERIPIPEALIIMRIFYDQI